MAAEPDVAEPGASIEELKRQLAEARAREAALGEVLEAINASRGDPAPVFEAILEKATRLCEASFGVLTLYRGDDRHEVAATRNVPPSVIEFFKGSIYMGPETGLGRLARGERFVHLPDAADDDGYRQGSPIRRALVDLAGTRTYLAVPLREDGALLGAFTIYRREVRPFSERQVALLQAFASQAVVAMANARLLVEQHEALEQQTATAEILRVIARSPTDVTPVLHAVAAAALRFCGAADAVVHLRKGDRISAGIHAGELSRPLQVADFPLTRDSAMARAIVDGETCHLPDMEALDPAEWATAREFAARHGHKSCVAAPMLLDGAAIGSVLLRKLETGPFTPRQIALLESFAAQAAIAVENVRLFTELKESLDQQTATAEILRVISQSPTDIKPVVIAVAKAAVRFCGAEEAAIVLREGEHWRTVALEGMGHEPADRATPITWESTPGRAMLDRQIVHVPDIEAVDPSENAFDRRVAQRLGFRAILGVPMLRDDQAIGAIVLHRGAPGAYPPRQIELLQSFAAQAVIAIENVRLFTELQQRTDDLTESLEYQTATSEVLEVISRSTSDQQPVLDTMLASAARLCGATTGGVAIRQGEGFRCVATVGWSPEYDKAVRAFQFGPGRGTVIGRTLLGKKVVHVTDTAVDPEYAPIDAAAFSEMGTSLGVPLVREGELIGAIALSRNRVETFSERQIALVKTFADQAVIAMENARLLSELRESLDQQTATAEILRVINASPGNLTPVFQAILEKAHSSCGADMGSLFVWDGTNIRAVVTIGYDAEIDEILRRSHAAPPSMAGLLSGERFYHRVHGQDRTEEPHTFGPRFLAGSRIRTNLIIPLRKDDAVLGFISANRREVRPYGDKEIALLENFAAQAVIAMENARLLAELRQRTADLTESLEYQTAIGEVLTAISRSTFDLAPVLQTLTATALRLCEAEMGFIARREGEVYRVVTSAGATAESARDALDYQRYQEAYPLAPGRGSLTGRVALEGRPLQIPDITVDPEYRLAGASTLGKIRTQVGVPLIREGMMVGVMVLSRQRVEPFPERQIALLSTFADQAVIAMENARLLSELTRREQELSVTFDHMGEGVVMFDAGLRLASWNTHFQKLLDIPDSFLAGRPGLEDYVRLLVERGELVGGEPERQIAFFRERANRAWSTERTRPDGRTIEVRNNPVPGGGAVLIYSDVTQRKQAEAEIAAARDTAEATLAQLKAAQANLVQSAKMASFGQLTAGIAHEIKNPLNFINNFASLSVELLDELKQAAAPALGQLDQARRAEADEAIELLTGNLGKISEHGKRVDGIVTSMLAHSRGGSGDWAPSNVDTLVEEALNLAYHGARAQDKEFNITLERDLAAGAGPIDLVPQDITRVFLNLIGNGFYAANKRRRDAPPGFRPALRVATRDLGEAVEIRVRDNGTGIASEARAKLFQPFFTTKPTGEGTGLGLSISYDIVTQQHGGTIDVESEVGQFTEFIVRLPRGRRVVPAEKA